MDHMRRGSLDLSDLRTLVLDEADEMLRMGFIDDVEWILTQTPAERQIALFSATMPDAIRRIARTHLRDPREVSIEVKTVINQLHTPARVDDGRCTQARCADPHSRSRGFSTA
jgi:ATP-dependent RNA helicase DeaD